MQCWPGLIRCSCGGRVAETVGPGQADRSVVEQFIAVGELIELEYRGYQFYLRRLLTTYGR